MEGGHFGVADEFDGPGSLSDLEKAQEAAEGWEERHFPAADDLQCYAWGVHWTGMLRGRSGFMRLYGKWAKWGVINTNLFIARLGWTGGGRDIGTFGPLVACGAGKMVNYG